MYFLSRCAAGHFQDRISSTACNPCKLGSYGPTTGLESCILCPQSYFTSENGSTTYERCDHVFGQGYTSSEGASTCDVCERHYFMNKQGICRKCPTGSSCSQADDIGNTVSGLAVLPGYYRFSDSSEQIYSCKATDNCIGGNNTQHLCAVGATGPLCMCLMQCLKLISPR